VENIPGYILNDLYFKGTPIAGALLSAQFTWWRPIVFAGVRRSFVASHHDQMLTENFKICLMASAGCFCIARFLVARTSGTQII
jgi:hypothetical protein